MSITIALAISHPRRTWRYALCAAAFVLASTPCVAFTCAAEPVTTTASTEQDEDAEPPAGLRAVYTDGAGRKIVRVDPAVRFHWQESPADPRLVAGKFTAHWSGKLLAIAPGQHRFHLFAAGGTVRLSIGGKSLIDQTAGAPQWIDSPPVDLEYGHHPLEIEFHRTAEDAAVDLYWSGPRFQVEHVPERALSHDPQLPIDLRFEQGRQLVHGLRCAACHAIHDAQPVPSAPSLAKLSGNVSRAWLMDWIGGRKESPHEPNPSNDIKNAASATDNAVLPQAPPAIDDVKFRMPGLGLSREDARHIVAYLLEESDSSATKLKPVPTNAVTTPQAETTSDAKAGDELFHSVGCLACHSVGPLGSRRLSGGGDLAAVGDKRPADFFARWLSAPQQIDARHRMPVFPLTDEERANLAGYLQTLRSVPAIEHAPPDAADFGGVRERGQKLVATHHCAACHEMPAAQPAASVSQLRPTRLQAQDNCLGEPNPRLARPGYRLRPDQRTAVIEYLGQILPSAESRAADDRPLRTAPPPRDGARLFADLNCLGCHSRGLAPGIAAQSADLVAAHPELAGALAALAPPALTDVGDKLERAALLEAMTTSASPRRPWLSIRMPRFQFAPGEAEALADWLITADRIPQRAAPPEATLAENALLTAGSRLVTSDGFGCASCHAIGKWSPKQDNLAARGTDLSLVGQRIRRSWFDRWVHNPARIVPRMEMPSIEIPVAGVLDERLDDQITAVWNVLNRPGFTPPAGGAIRVVRRRNLPEEVEQAALLTDVLRIDGRSMIRPLAIGLSNRHNILFDLEQNRFTGWWLGDVARERTEGKRWFWEPGGTHLLPTPKQGGASDIVIERGEQRVEPLVVGQCAAQLDAWRHVPGGIAFEMRLSFPGLDNSAAKNLHIQQTFLSLPVDTAGQSGFRRRIEIHQAPEQANIILRLFPEIFSGTIDGNQFSTSAGPAGRLTASVTTPGNAQLVDAERGGTVRLSGSAGQAIVCEVEYTSALAADRYPGPVVASASRPAPADRPSRC